MMLTHEQINRIAEEILGANLGSSGFDHADVADDVDVDGTEAVRITAHFRPGAQPADGRTVLSAITALHVKLRASGEERFPFVRYDFPDDDVPAVSSDDFAA